MQINFEWDPEKAQKNKVKHNITFELAASIFNDPYALSIYDDEHSSLKEDRWVTLGVSKTGALLVVVHTFEELTKNINQIRIISARKATKNEIKQYQGK